MEEARLLNSIVKMEEDLKLNNISIYDVPIWRIVRYHTRLHYINKKTGYVAGEPAIKRSIPQPKLFSGFWHYIGKKNLSLFFSFNRLVRNNGVYLDKFIDPIIEETTLNESDCCIVDSRNYYGRYNRTHKKITVSNESRTITIQLFKYFYRFLTPFLYRKTIKELFDLVKDPFELTDKDIRRFYSSVGLFIAYYRYYYLWFSILKPKRVFLVFREGYFPQIAVCKKMNIPVAEFQHGITIDNTVSYTGNYDYRIDPDYFLVFGDFWKGPQFGMPLDRIINIGWAYSKYLQKSLGEKTERDCRKILVISSPEVSDAILDTLQELCEYEGDFIFDIRLHPCESYNESQQQKLRTLPKAQIVDNKTDSALVVPTYKYVVGENSSVIYEALSVGCKVGMLNMCGLRPAIDLPGIKDNFYIINNREDFERFLTEDSNQSTSKAEFYSEFDSKRFMEFIENKM